MLLNHCKIDKTDTCLTYVNKRVGLKVPIDGMNRIHKYFEFQPFELNNLETGTIVCWVREDRPAYLSIPSEIDCYGQIMNHDFQVNMHLGVVENSPLLRISDCWKLPYLEGKQLIRIPTIRIRGIEDLERMPDHILIPYEKYVKSPKK